MHACVSACVRVRACACVCECECVCVCVCVCAIEVTLHNLQTISTFPAMPSR